MMMKIQRKADIVLLQSHFSSVDLYVSQYPDPKKTRGLSMESAIRDHCELFEILLIAVLPLHNDRH